MRNFCAMLLPRLQQRAADLCHNTKSALDLNLYRKMKIMTRMVAHHCGRKSQIAPHLNDGPTIATTAHTITNSLADRYALE